MFNKECIIYDNKICDDCGDCNFCDINPDKICDNCGLCLDDYDYSGIHVDELILDNEKDGINSEYAGEMWKFSKRQDEENDKYKEDNDVIFIDDVEGLREAIEGHEVHGHDYCNHDHDHM